MHRKWFMAQRRAGQQGQGLVEYALIIALVAIVVIAILVLMGPQIGKKFSAPSPTASDSALEREYTLGFNRPQIGGGWAREAR